MKDIARFNALKAKRNIVSLNYAQREKENNEDDATRLARINDRFKREGKPLLKKLDDLPKDYQSPIRIWTRRCISRLISRSWKRETCCATCSDKIIPNRHKKLCLFLCSSSFRQADFQLCKVVSFW